jgi:hypothetical protein
MDVLPCNKIALLILIKQCAIMQPIRLSACQMEVNVIHLTRLAISLQQIAMMNVRHIEPFVNILPLLQDNKPV